MNGVGVFWGRGNVKEEKYMLFGKNKMIGFFREMNDFIIEINYWFYLIILF